LDTVTTLIADIRSARTELNVPPGARLESYVQGGSPDDQLTLKRSWSTISKLARVEWSDLPAANLGAGNSIQVMAGEITIALQLEGVIDVEAEKARLAKGLAAAEKERNSLAQRLSNPNFTERAKAEAVDKARADHEAKSAQAERLRAALERLA
jgi:valyl-tRNA synthetase